MSQSGTAVAHWVLQDTNEGEFERQDLEEERQKLEDDRKLLENERRMLEQERKEFQWKKKMEEQRMAREKQLFDMKWKILEDELVKLAKEKQDVEWAKEQYCGSSQDCFIEENGQQIVKGELFFSGVRSEGALKKRYKDLIKIFHPDNVAGDNNTLLEINREYDNLRKAFEG